MSSLEAGSHLHLRIASNALSYMGFSPTAVEHQPLPLESSLQVLFNHQKLFNPQLPSNPQVLLNPLLLFSLQLPFNLRLFNN